MWQALHHLNHLPKPDSLHTHAFMCNSNWGKSIYLLCLFPPVRLFWVSPLYKTLYWAWGLSSRSGSESSSLRFVSWTSDAWEQPQMWQKGSCGCTPIINPAKWIVYSLTEMGSELDLAHRLEFADLCSTFLMPGWKQIVSIDVAPWYYWATPERTHTHQRKGDLSFKLSPNRWMSGHSSSEMQLSRHVAHSTMPGRLTELETWMVLTGFFHSFILLRRDSGGQTREGKNGGEVHSCLPVILRPSSFLLKKNKKQKTSSLKWMPSEHNVKALPLPAT